MPASSQHKIKIVVEGEDKASGALKSAGSALDGFGKGARDLGGKLTAGITAPLLGLGALAIKASTDLNAAMANVASLGVPTERVLELKSAVQELAIETGKSTADLADGLYQVVSAFGDTADTVQILEINAKAAAAGLATTTDAINLTSAVTKGYGDTSAAAVQKASDLAFVAVQLGQTTFPELAGAIGMVVPLAQELSISQEELFATMATLTGVTGGASEVSTQLRGVLQSLMAPTGDMTTLMQKLGYANGEAMIQSLGMKGTIDAITAAAEATGTPLAKFIGSIEGQTLALSLSGSQSDTYAEKLKAMQTAAGATDAAFAAQTEGINALGFSWQQAQQKLTVFTQKLGDALAPALMSAMENMQPLLDGILGLANGFARLSPTMQKIVLAVGGAAVAIGPLIFAIGALSSAVSAALPVVGAIGGALGLLLSPIGLVAGAIAGLGVVFYRLNIGGFGDLVDGLIVKFGNWDAVVAIAQALWATFVPYLSAAAVNIAGIATQITGVVTGFVQWATSTATLNAAWAIFNAAVATAQSAWATFVPYLTSAVTSITTLATQAAIVAVGFVRWATSATTLNAAWSTATSTLSNLGVQVVGIWASFTGFLSAVTSLATTIGGIFIPRITEASGSFAGLGEKLPGLVTAFSGLLTALAPVGKAITLLAGAVGIGALDIALNAIPATIGLVGTALNAFVDAATAIFAGLGEVVSGFTLIFTGAFSGNWSTVLEGAQTVMVGFGTIVGGALSGLSTLIGGVVTAIGTLAAGVAADMGFTAAAAQIKIVTDSIENMFNWVAKLFAGDNTLKITVPEWLTTLLAWVWPSVPDQGWIAGLFTWDWPKIPDKGWIADLFNWKWPSFDQPGWLKDLLKWKWPSLPALPSWLGGPATTTTGNATGTPFWRGGQTWVGEKGPELVTLPRGSRILNHERSMAMVGSASSGGDTYNITFAPAVNSQIDLEVAFDQLLRKMERRRP